MPCVFVENACCIFQRAMSIYRSEHIKFSQEALLLHRTYTDFPGTSTLRAETFAGIKFRVFRVFWSFSRKFLPLEIINHQNAKVFSREITNIFQTRKFFWQVTNSCSIFSRVNMSFTHNSRKFFPRNL